jgi:hypothetical protein
MISGAIALMKYIFILGFFLSIGWALLKEHEAKNKVIEIVIGCILLAIALGLPKLVISMAGSNAQNVENIVDSWDPTPLFGSTN